MKLRLILSCIFAYVIACTGSAYSMNAPAKSETPSLRQVCNYKRVLLNLAGNWDENTGELAPHAFLHALNQGLNYPNAVRYCGLQVQKVEKIVNLDQLKQCINQLLDSTRKMTKDEQSNLLKSAFPLRSQFYTDNPDFKQNVDDLIDNTVEYLNLERIDGETEEQAAAFEAQLVDTILENARDILFGAGFIHKDQAVAVANDFMDYSFLGLILSAKIERWINKDALKIAIGHHVKKEPITDDEIMACIKWDEFLTYCDSTESLKFVSKAIGTGDRLQARVKEFTNPRFIAVVIAKLIQGLQANKEFIQLFNTTNIARPLCLPEPVVRGALNFDLAEENQRECVARVWSALQDHSNTRLRLLGVVYALIAIYVLSEPLLLADTASIAQVALRPSSAIMGIILCGILIKTTQYLSLNLTALPTEVDTSSLELSGQAISLYRLFLEREEPTTAAASQDVAPVAEDVAPAAEAEIQ